MKCYIKYKGLTNLTLYERFHKKPDFKFIAIHKQKSCRQACAYAQSDQHLYYLLSGKYYSYRPPDKSV